MHGVNIISPVTAPVNNLKCHVICFNFMEQSIIEPGFLVNRQILHRGDFTTRLVIAGWSKIRDYRRFAVFSGQGDLCGEEVAVIIP